MAVVKNKEVRAPEKQGALIRVKLFKSAYNSKRGGIIKEGAILEIHETEFDEWSKVAVELEE